MKNAFSKIVATLTFVLGFLSIASAQTQNPLASPDTSNTVKTPKVSDEAKKGAATFVKDSDTHTQTPGHSKFGTSVDKGSKINVQKAAAKAKQRN